MKRSLPQSTKIWYLVDNSGEWGEIRFDFEHGTSEIVKLVDRDTVKSNVFEKTEIHFVQELSKQTVAGNYIDLLCVGYKEFSKHSEILRPKQIKSYL